MKKIILIGPVGCGKTTLCQLLNGLAQEYKKTQALEVVGRTIDTPGEYLEHRSFLRGLIVTATEAEHVLFLIDPTSETFNYSTGQAASFPIPVAGVVTKTDVATEKQVRQAHELLELTGADPIFEICSLTGSGMDALIEFLSDKAAQTEKK